MRKFLLVLLALVMMVGLAMAENDSKPMPAEAAAFEGEWQCDRATAELVWEEEGFKVLITWGSSAWETTQWEYSCYYHEEDNTLVSMPFGIRTDLVYDDNGNETSATAAYEDGQATFKIDEDGRLIWIDFNSRLVDETGWVPKSIMADEIHPSDAEYDIWMEALAPVLGK